MPVLSMCTALVKPYKTCTQGITSHPSDVENADAETAHRTTTLLTLQHRLHCLSLNFLHGVNEQSEGTLEYTTELRFMDLNIEC